MSAQRLRDAWKAAGWRVERIDDAGFAVRLNSGAHTGVAHALLLLAVKAPP